MIIKSGRASSARAKERRTRSPVLIPLPSASSVESRSSNRGPLSPKDERHVRTSTSEICSPSVRLPRKVPENNDLSPLTWPARTAERATDPLRGSRQSTSVSSSVVLPEPEGPVTKRDWPGSRLKLIGWPPAEVTRSVALSNDEVVVGGRKVGASSARSDRSESSRR